MGTKKEKGVSREQQYRDIVEAAGIRLEDCMVLSYSFPDDASARAFHYDLYFSHIKSLVVDCCGPASTIITTQEMNVITDVEKRIDALAGQNGGRRCGSQSKTMP